MIGFKELLIILVVVLLVFGTKKLRSLGGDLGSAIKDFKKNVSDDKNKTEDAGDAVIDNKIIEQVQETSTTDAKIHKQHTDTQHKNG